MQSEPGQPGKRFGQILGLGLLVDMVALVVCWIGNIRTPLYWSIALFGGLLLTLTLWTVWRIPYMDKQQFAASGFGARGKRRLFLIFSIAAAAAFAVWTGLYGLGRLQQSPPRTMTVEVADSFPDTRRGSPPRLVLIDPADSGRVIMSSDYASYDLVRGIKGQKMFTCTIVSYPYVGSGKVSNCRLPLAGEQPSSRPLIENAWQWSWWAVAGIGIMVGMLLPLQLRRRAER